MPLPQEPLTLEEEIGRLDSAEDRSMITELMKEIDADRIASYGFRHSAPSTQYQQDRHLRGYYSFIRAINDKSPDLSEEATKSLAFPTDTKKLLINLQNFILFVFKRVKVRTDITNPGESGNMRYATLIGYRKSLLFWVPRMYQDLGLEPPSSKVIFQALAETMRYVQRTYGTPNQKINRSGLGLIELRQLLEFEMSTARYIDYSEQHQLIWCLARQTALRPGSIGWSKHRRGNFLRWEDVQIINKKEGAFTVVFNIKHLKTNYDDPERGEHQTSENSIDTPNIDNLIFSVPHRLLMIAIRRKILLNIDSISDLMSYERAKIQVKAEFLKDPIFYAGRPGGRGIDTSDSPPESRAMSALTVSGYLSDRCRAIGYTVPITLYSIRRRVATDLVIRVGPEVARDIMGHDPRSSILERYYLNRRPILDLTSATLGQEVGAGGISADSANYAPVAETKLPAEIMRDIQGVALDRLVEEMTENDPNYPVNADQAELKKYLRRVRAYALTTLINEAATTQSETITVTDLRARQEQLKNSAGAFAERVRAHAKRLMAASAGVDEERLQRQEGVDLDRPFTDPNANIEDLDGAPNMDADRGEEFDRTREDDTINSLGTELRDDFEANARAFLDMLESNALSDRPTTFIARADKTCPACQEDETVPRETAEKVWTNASNLRDHMETGEYHSAKGRWRRTQEMKAMEVKEATPDIKSPYHCPYSNCTRSYHNLKKLIDHIQKSLDKPTKNVEHYESILDDGWLEPDWKGVPHARSQHDRARERVAAFNKAGINLARGSYSRGAPDPERPSIWWGDKGGAAPTVIPKRFRNCISVGNQGGSTPIYKPPPAHLAKYLTFGPPKISSDPPDHVKNSVTFGGASATVRTEPVRKKRTRDVSNESPFVPISNAPLRKRLRLPPPLPENLTMMGGGLPADASEGGALE